MTAAEKWLAVYRASTAIAVRELQQIAELAERLRRDVNQHRAGETDVVVKLLRISRLATRSGEELDRSLARAQARDHSTSSVGT